MENLFTCWEAHRDAAWPQQAGPREGQLMTLDTVISGCMTYFLDASEGLDPQRRDMLVSCLSELDELLPELPAEALPYFERLRTLGKLLLGAHGLDGA